MGKISETTTSYPESYPHRNYTLSELAYNGLFTRLLPSKSDLELPYNTDDGIQFHAVKNRRREGVSHALNTFSLLSLEVWLDTRPPFIRANHKTILEYTDACRLPWYYQPDLSSLALDQDDPDFLELIPTVEEQLSLPKHCIRRSLSLTPNARLYYSQLARMYKMETRSNRHTLGNYTAAAIEAIGIGWLSLPELYSLPPNYNKLRPGFGRTSNNDHLRPWDMTKQELEEVAKHGYDRRLHPPEPNEGAKPEVQ